MTTNLDVVVVHKDGELVKVKVLEAFIEGNNTKYIARTDTGEIVYFGAYLIDDIISTHRDNEIERQAKLLNMSQSVQSFFQQASTENNFGLPMSDEEEDI